MDAMNDLFAHPSEDGDGSEVIHPAVAAAFRALDQARLTWVLLRGENDLTRPSGDVDILLAPEHLTGLDELMGGIGFCRVRAPGHGSHQFYFHYSSIDELWVKLDIVSDICFGPFQQWPTPLAPGCLGRRVRRGLLWLPAPADQAWLQLLHLVLDKGEIAPQRMEIARSAAEVASVGDVIADFVDRRMGHGTAARLLKLVQSGRIEGIPAMAARMRSSWTGTPVSLGRLLAARNRGLRLLGPRTRGRGLVVGVMAPDGAGKTTLLHGLRADFPLPTKYVYMGMWGAGPWDSWLRGIPGGRTAKMLFRLVRGGLATKYHTLRGRLVLMDRVAYDAMLPGTNDAGALAKMTNALAFGLGPEPDVLLVLDVPGHVMFARKGEHSPDILETWRQAYLQLADRLPGSWVIDAAQPKDLVQSQATEIVWSRLSPGGAYTHEADQGGAGTREADGAGALSLHLWRLLDWRFLLPVLQPKSLAYGGTPSRDMLSALRLLDPSAAAIASDHDGDPHQTFDVVLLTAPDLTLLEAAASAVQPGGWVCAEIRRSFLRRSGPRTLKGWKRAFIRSGFRDVSVYWNAPTLERTARIVPVESAAAIRDTLSLHQDVRFGKAKAIAAHLALALRLFDIAIPEGTVTGRRPQGEETQ